MIQLQGWATGSEVVLEAHGYHVSILLEERLGYIVYEDEHQVIAEPFADTRTG